jgi:hypothetical protein
MLVLAAAMLVGSLGAYACGGSSGSEGPKGPEKQAVGLAGDDRSRCDFRGRADREQQETAGPGAKWQNIRRVYGILGEGEDRRRVLLCREVDTNLDGMKDVVRTYTDKGDAMNEVADTNFDGRYDTWISFTKGRVGKVQIDKNSDGQADVTRFYVNGTLSRAQRDSNYDNKVDVWEIYADGKLERMGFDLDFDGHVDRWDRDEIALRDIEQKERAQEPAEGKTEGSSDVADAGVTDAHVSARNR